MWLPHLCRELLLIRGLEKTVLKCHSVENYSAIKRIYICSNLDEVYWYMKFTDICSNLDEVPGNYAEWETASPKRLRLYKSTPLTILKWQNYRNGDRINGDYSSRMRARGKWMLAVKGQHESLWWWECPLSAWVRSVSWLWYCTVVFARCCHWGKEDRKNCPVWGGPIP